MSVHDTVSCFSTSVMFDNIVAVEFFDKLITAYGTWPDD